MRKRDNWKKLLQYYHIRLLLFVKSLRYLFIKGDALDKIQTIIKEKRL